MSNSGKKNNEISDSLDIQPPGVRLRRAREASDLSREEVATYLRLSVKKIESLERGEVTSIAAPVYVAGYLRSYAKLVHLSGDEIVADFEALSSMDSPSVDPSSGPAANDYGKVVSTPFLRKILKGGNVWVRLSILGLLCGALILMGYVFIGGDEIYGVKDVKNSSEDEQNHASTASEISRRGSDRLDEQEKTTESSMEGVSDKTPSSIIDKQDETALPINKAVPKQSELTLYFNKESWVDVSDAQDTRLLFQMGKAGMSQTVKGIAPFNIRLGFVNGVTINYNGNPYDLSHLAGQNSARFQVGKIGDQMSGNQKQGNL